MNTTISLRPPVQKMVIGSINWAQGNRIMSSFYHLPIENCIPMTRDALSIEAVGRRANNVCITTFNPGLGQ